MGVVRPARRTELLHFELLSHRSLVLVRRIVGAAAIAAGKLDEIAHVETPEMSRKNIESGGALVYLFWRGRQHKAAQNWEKPL